MPDPFRRRHPIPLREQRAAQVDAGVEEINPDPETIRRVWETKRDLVLLESEHSRLKDGLELIRQMETFPDRKFEEVPGLNDAHDLVDAFHAENPGISTLDLLPIVKKHLDLGLKKEIDAARREGLPVPSAEEAPVIRDYLEIENDTQRILRGLEDLTKNPHAKTREGARAQHFMARVETKSGHGTTDLVFARAQANQRLRLKKAELKKLKILIP